MNRIRLEIFGRAAECTAFLASPDEGICFELGEGVSGFLSLGGATRRVEGGFCTVDTRNLPDGEYEPVLILERTTVRLPKIKKTARKIRLADCTAEYIRECSVRERRLAARVAELEGKISELYEKISSATVLKFK